MDLEETQKIIFLGSFYEGIYPILLGSQVFGILPLKDIRKYTSNGVHFKWFSVASLTCLIYMTCDLITMLCHIHFNRNNGVSAGSLSTNIFFSMGILIYAAFLNLARRWVVIIGWWTEKEQRFLKPPYMVKRSKKLKNKLFLIGITIAALAVVEHALFQISGIYKYFRVGKECNVTNWGFDDYINGSFDYVLTFIPYRFVAILCQLVSWFGTVAWNFLDLFIIIISNGIVIRFEQLTRALKHHLKHNVPDSNSMLKFRMDFTAICDLLVYVDKEMGVFVFLSAANNLFFVCKQLLYVFNPLRFFIDYLYYWYSILYLIGRTLYLFVSAAAINESAQGPKALLHDIPQEYWNDESERFLYQINSNTIALSAMGFCNFTRGIILTMAGAIVTFELVMMQFGDTVDSLGPLCG